MGTMYLSKTRAPPRVANEMTYAPARSPFPHGVGTASRANLFRSVLSRLGIKEREKGKTRKKGKAPNKRKTSKSGEYKVVPRQSIENLPSRKHRERTRKTGKNEKKKRKTNNEIK